MENYIIIIDNKVSKILGLLYKAKEVPTHECITPFDETHLVVVRGLIHQEVSPRGISKEGSVRRLIHQEVSPRCISDEGSTERCSHNRQVSRSPQLLCQDLSQY